MNLPSPDEQLDLHGPRAKLPFEQIPPHARAGVKSSHGTSDDSNAARYDTNGVLNAAGGSLSTTAATAPIGVGSGHDLLQSSPHEIARDRLDPGHPSTGGGHTTPPGIMEQHRSDSETTRAGSSTSESAPPSPKHMGTKASGGPQRPLGSYSLGESHEASNGQPPVKRPGLQKAMKMMRRFAGFIGPGYIVSVGYMDPGNWATDLAGGSQFGYQLLFVILMSNLMAVVLQALAVKLGVVTGLDLAQACRRYTPKYINWILYVLAELAIVACDLAEVIGSAIALKLLFNIPLAWGVVITAVDVLLVLLAFRDDQSVRARRIFEGLVIILVTVVGACFTAEIVYSKPNANDVFRGYLPSNIFSNSEMLFLAIGIIGATVMPHNLYLHSNIVKLRTTRELNRLASSQASMSSTMSLTHDMEDQDESVVSVKHSTIRSTLRYTIVDSTIALTFALYVNSAILIVSAATFYYNYPQETEGGVADLFDAFHLLSMYLGKAAGYLFAIALLMAGQSSTLTATLAGQIVMEGFLGVSFLKPWVRRLLTRSLAIIPALAIVLIKGDKGLSELLLWSQVALSIQLPFAVIPLVIFTSWKRCMTIAVQDYADKPGQIAYGKLVDDTKEPEVEGVDYQDEEDGSAPLLMHDFSNPWWLIIVAGIISILLLTLNFYMLVQTIRGE
ncbi:hypothetical protein DFQ27_008029 [Actinomortierella ambigua]|uniref:Natural resistance-associated macrophage protein n=1 Tax=Actinomortierella ambigua TaxID=1343610 RepID=A0A9P6PUV1_9FUNG|nr:hypothetical protein DFQ26_004929 [Actinomortierella ambigua]KAG0252501.1 hypothetical protein DFQ27_008029 [Actinomortierella ambigua]